MKSVFKALDYQRFIYLSGFSGQKPKIAPDWTRLEKDALAKMSAPAANYIFGGAGTQQTMVNNRLGFKQYRIIPKMLVNVEQRNTKLTLFNQVFPAPFWLSPIGVSELVHPDGDIAIAKACATTGIPMVFSNQASVSMEACAAVMGDSPRFFQLYWSKSRELVASFVKRAESCGCSGIIVTLDTQMLGWRTKDLELAYLPFLQGKGIAQYTSDPVFQSLLDESLNKPASEADFKPKLSLSTLRNLVACVNSYPGKESFLKKLRSRRPLAAVKLFTGIYSNPALTWNDLAVLREMTALPIILKGILHPDDARMALDHHVDGIIVSNHGGRQIDGAIGAIEALPAIIEVVKGEIPVLLDSGIRGGADVFMALALGATAVGLGRPYIYGLAIDGEKGVETVIRQLQADFELTMGLSGCCNLQEITRDKLIKI